MTGLDDAALHVRFEAAAAVAREAGALALDIVRGPAAQLAIAEKGTLDLCTEADRASERLIRARLAERFGDAMLGEEYGGVTGEHLWVVDPIDGTFNLVHGFPMWAISIGFVQAGVPTLGIVYNPVRDEMFAARLGHGATLNGAPLAVSGERNVDRPLVEVGYSSSKPLEPYLALIGRLLADGCEFRRTGSAALGLAQVAAGWTDGYVETHVHSWDVAAGLVLVREAGGWTNDFLGGDGLTRGNPILACTPALRARLSALSGIV